MVLERPPGLVGVTQRGYPTGEVQGTVLQRPGLLGIAKLQSPGVAPHRPGLTGVGLAPRGYANGAVQGMVLEHPGLTALSKQGPRVYPYGEVHATATIQMGGNWGGQKDGLPLLGKRKKLSGPPPDCFMDGSGEVSALHSCLNRMQDSIGTYRFKSL